MNGSFLRTMLHPGTSSINSTRSNEQTRLTDDVPPADSLNQSCGLRALKFSAALTGTYGLTALIGTLINWSTTEANPLLGKILMDIGGTGVAAGILMGIGAVAYNNCCEDAGDSTLNDSPV